MSLVQVTGLGVRTPSVSLLDGVDLTIEQGDSIALLGPSGSGKTTLLSALAGFVAPGLSASGTVVFDGTDVLAATEETLRDLRGRRIGLVPQDARGSLDPLWRVGAQFREVVRAHEDVSRNEANERARKLLRSVGFDDPDSVMHSFPHRLSGGMCQRVVLAMALAHDPELLLIDEPASMLDAVSADEVMSLIADQRERVGCSMVVVTHDPVVAARLCSTALTVDAGTVLATPSTPANVPGAVRESTKPGTAAALRVAAVDASYGAVPVLRNFELHVAEGETVGLVGRSGCGKSTAIRLMLGLVRASSGVVEVAGCDVGTAGKAALRDVRRRIGVVFQDPFAALDPRLSIGTSIAEFARSAGDGGKGMEVADAMLRAGLDPELAGRHPSRLSGGQLQRACIARAIVRRPRVLLLDEPTSALDAAVREGLLRTIGELTADGAMSCLFVSHDLRSVRSVADRVAVMDKGTVVEMGTTAQIFEQPTHEATVELLRVT